MNIIKPTSANNNIKINWPEQKSKLKAKFPTLTDADLNFERGKNDEMFGKLYKKLGKTKEEMNAIIDKL